MTVKKAKQTIEDWIADQAASYPDISGLPITQNGEISDMEFPMISIVETGAEQHEANGVIMRGVMEISLNVELHSVPATDDQDGTDEADHSDIEADLYDILGDLTFLSWAQNRNNLLFFDIRTAAPIVEARDGRRVSTFAILLICCPN
jgi:hypothetical protein